VTSHNLATNAASDMTGVRIRRRFFAEPLRHAATHSVPDCTSAY